MKRHRVKVERCLSGRYRYQLRRRDDGRVVAQSKDRFVSVGDAKAGARAEEKRMVML